MPAIGSVAELVLIDGDTVIVDPFTVCITLSCTDPSFLIIEKLSPATPKEVSVLSSTTIVVVLPDVLTDFIRPDVLIVSFDLSAIFITIKGSNIQAASIPQSKVTNSVSKFEL